MPNTYTLIASTTVGSGGAATIDFTSIPNTYTDLVLKLSLRTNSTGSGNGVNLSLNNLTTNFTNRSVLGDATGAVASYTATRFGGFVNGSNETAGQFAPTTLYFPSYNNGNHKTISFETAMFGNSAYYVGFVGTIWQNTAAIDRITLTPQVGSFVQYSTAFLYGISNS